MMMLLLLRIEGWLMVKPVTIVAVESSVMKVLPAHISCF